MSACDTLRLRAALLAALPPHDPDRREFDEHARACADCTRALREGQQLVQLLGMATLQQPEAQALRRAASPILLRLRLAQALLPASALAAFALLVLLSSTRLPGAAVALVLAALAAGAAALLRLPRLALGGAVLVSLAAALAVGQGQLFAASSGAGCLLLEQVAALLPFGALALVRRGRALEFAAAAAAGALAGQAALHLTCPDRLIAGHLFAFHFAGVLVAAAWGALGGRLLSPVRALGA